MVFFLSFINADYPKSIMHYRLISEWKSFANFADIKPSVKLGVDSTKVYRAAGVLTNL